MTQANIATAAYYWCYDTDYASTEYGHISTWLTDANTQYTTITNFLNLFGYGECQEFNEDLNAWDTSRITNMDQVFAYNYAFDQTLAWDTSSCTTMRLMFYLATAMQGDLSSFDTSKVTDMFGTFIYTEYNQPLSTWDVSSVGDMGYMFRGYEDTEVYTELQPYIDNWDVSQVTTFEAR